MVRYKHVSCGQAHTSQQAKDLNIGDISLFEAHHGVSALISAVILACVAVAIVAGYDS